jgi:hypothetical protein
MYVEKYNFCHIDKKGKKYWKCMDYYRFRGGLQDISEK